MDWAVISTAILKTAISILAVCGAPLLAKARTWLDAQATSTAAKSTFRIIEAVVADLVQALGPELKKKLDTGALTQADFRQLSDSALSRLRQMFGPEGIDRLTKALKLQGSSTETFLDSQVKLAVYNMRYPNQGTLPPFLQGNPKGEAAPAQTPVTPAKVTP